MDSITEITNSFVNELFDKKGFDVYQQILEVCGNSEKAKDMTANAFSALHKAIEEDISLAENYTAREAYLDNRVSTIIRAYKDLSQIRERIQRSSSNTQTISSVVTPQKINVKRAREIMRMDYPDTADKTKKVSGSDAVEMKNDFDENGQTGFVFDVDATLSNDVTPEITEPVRQEAVDEKKAVPEFTPLSELKDEKLESGSMASMWNAYSSESAEETEKRKSGHSFISALLTIILILLGVILLWGIAGFLMKLDIIPEYDLYYSWFNAHILELF